LPDAISPDSFPEDLYPSRRWLPQCLFPWTALNGIRPTSHEYQSRPFSESRATRPESCDETPAHQMNDMAFITGQCSCLSWLTSESGRVRQTHPIFLFVWFFLTPIPFWSQSGRSAPLGNHFASETSCRARQHCAECSCAVANHHPRRRGKTGRDWPYKASTRQSGLFPERGQFWNRRSVSNPRANAGI